jgi:hypothetical protein
MDRALDSRQCVMSEVAMQHDKGNEYER